MAEAFIGQREQLFPNGKVRGSIPLLSGSSRALLSFFSNCHSEKTGEGRQTSPNRGTARPSSIPSLKYHTPLACPQSGKSSVGVLYLRNTPTDVGKTGQSLCVAAWARKHPHGRGEDAFSTAPNTLSRETPPRTWGRLVELLQMSAETGNTPTDVGKTGLRPAGAGYPQKHPHGRGEDGL